MTITVVLFCHSVVWFEINLEYCLGWNQCGGWNNRCGGNAGNWNGPQWCGDFHNWTGKCIALIVMQCVVIVFVSNMCR